MALCKYCGLGIDWLETPDGRRVPVDREPVLVATSPDGDIYYTDAGEVVRGWKIGDARLPAMGVLPDEAVFVPHGRTCPARGPRTLR